MQPDFPLSLTYPDGSNKPPVCKSKDVLAAFNSASQGQDYMSQTKQWRSRQGGRGRQWETENIPIHLYKYRQLDPENGAQVEHARDILVRDRIWVAKPDSLNDLHELNFNLVKNPNPSRLREWAENGTRQLCPKLSSAERLRDIKNIIDVPITKPMIEGLREDMRRVGGVFCASQDPRNGPMWAHYADNHRGICIQYDTTEDELFLLTKKVQYTPQLPTMMAPSDPGKPPDYYRYKSAEWAYEREWRVMIFCNSGLSVTVRPSTISGVIFGVRANQATVKIVSELLAERVAWGKPAFKLYRTKPHDDRYGIAITCMKP
ncbi:DUF2971 domain-containing protein [Verminephrobacter eiseniae]|uniref:DUF2971 domain-containing protein n=1 Tax=Verminephrobacter eiseniae TaxID=364317 RepID=UPI002238F093|nr:DUF2971 domain-containing protein [Verminephrobacter eiseniae]MCW5259222.1 DUF2971 domain-containing protein [Verminephrobacter eiseniae]